MFEYSNSLVVLKLHGGGIMKAAEIENETIVIKDRENEVLNGRKGAIVKVLGCGLCGSDIVKLTQGLAKTVLFSDMKLWLQLWKLIQILILKKAMLL